MVSSLLQRFRRNRGLTACAAGDFFLGSRYFSYQTHGFFTIASFGTSIFRLQLLYLLVQRNGFTCRFQALKHRPLGKQLWQYCLIGTGLQQQLHLTSSSWSHKVLHPVKMSLHGWWASKLKKKKEQENQDEGCIELQLVLSAGAPSTSASSTSRSATATAFFSPSASVSSATVSFPTTAKGGRINRNTITGLDQFFNILNFTYFSEGLPLSKKVFVDNKILLRKSY